MNNCAGRKHRWVDMASSGLDPSGKVKLQADNSMKEGYKFPCCQLTVPTVCCMYPSIYSSAMNNNHTRIKHYRHTIPDSSAQKKFSPFFFLWGWGGLGCFRDKIEAWGKWKPYNLFLNYRENLQWQVNVSIKLRVNHYWICVFVSLSFIIAIGVF